MQGVALKNKINVLAKEQGIAPINDFTIEQIRDLQNKDWAVMAEEMKGGSTHTGKKPAYFNFLLSSTF